MAQVNVTISDAQYTQLLTALQAWKSRLETLREPLRRLLGNETYRERVIQFAQSDAGRLLKLTHQTHRWLDEFMADIGWRED